MIAGSHGEIAEGRLLAFAAATLAAIVLTRLDVSASPVLIAVALGGICVAIWHGAYDSVTARDLLQGSLRRRWWVAFLGGYAAMVCAGLLLWRVAPEAALCSFLIYSSWHFGTEERVEYLTPLVAVRSLAEGAIPIVAACYWHAQGVLPIFAAMLGSGSQARAHTVLAVLGEAFIPVVVVATTGALLVGYGESRWREAGSALLRLCVELLLFYLCPPLLAFAVYFCVWHTPQHLVGSSLDANGSFSGDRLRRNLLSGVPYWLLSLLGLVGFVHFAPAGWLGFTASLFIVLSVLTVPHMLLHELRRRQLRVVGQITGSGRGRGHSLAPVRR